MTWVGLLNKYIYYIYIHSNDYIENDAKEKIKDNNQLLYSTERI